MMIGYMRVSKTDGSQILDLQKDALINAGVSSKDIFEDYASSVKDKRPGFNECMKSMTAGDILVVWRLDRLGRNLSQLVFIIEDLQKRSIDLKILTGFAANIDTTSSFGKLFFSICAAFAEYERSQLIERTKAGLASARARGRNGGRPRKMDLETLKMVAICMADSSAVASKVAEKFGITTSTLYSYVNPDGTYKEKGQKLMKKTLSEAGH